MANETRRVHQDLEAPLVCSKTGQALLVQGLCRHPRVEATRRDTSGRVLNGERSGGRAQQAVRLRAVDEDRDDVLHRGFREGEGGLDQLDRTVHSAALEIRY